MTTPSGTIALSDVNIELGKSSTAQISLNDSDVRTLAGILSGTISMNDLRGKSSYSGILYSWGTNTYGFNGDNTVIDRSSPVTVLGGFTDWISVAGANYWKAAVRNNGSAWAWGQNGFGQLGDGTTINRSSPVSVIGGITDWKSIAIDFAQPHAAAVRNNGTIWCWGVNLLGELGDGTSVSRSSPVAVVGGITDFNSVACNGNRAVIGVRNSGTAWGWGNNPFGNLGINSASNYFSSPLSVVGGFTDWKQISCSYYCTFGVRTNGTLWSWGTNANIGALGNNSASSAFSSPISVVGGFTDWSKCAAGYDYGLAIRTNGTMWSWGRNGSGELGLNNITSYSSPVSVFGGITDWKYVATSDTNRPTTYGVRSNGTAYAWGSNDSSSIGNSQSLSINYSSPVLIAGGITNWGPIATRIILSGGPFT